jgi:DNA-binding transcriptional regulator YhcF (GntR family)
MSDPQFDRKKYLGLFCASKESRLNYADLLVYCYRAQQHAYDTLPSHRRTAKATGLKEETVASATARLHDHGLLEPDGAVLSPCSWKGWFNELDSLREKFADQHWSMWFQNWRCYIRQPGADNPLTVPCVMLYSLIRHSVLRGWKPPEGWSHEYIALITGINAKTVSNSLERLEALGFLTVLDGMRFRLFKLRDCQLGYFADKRAWSGSASSEPDEIVGDLSPASLVLEEKAKAKNALVAMLNRNLDSDKDKDRIYKEIASQTDWFKGNWQDVVLKAVGKVYERLETPA